MPQETDVFSSKDPDSKTTKKKVVKKNPSTVVKDTKMNNTIVNDRISKTKTITGSAPDQIEMNPQFHTNSTDLNKKFNNHIISELVAKVADVYDQVEEDYDRNDTHLRDEGTTPLKNIYKSDTPGQVVDDKFKLKFKNPKNDKEATSRSGNPERKKMDEVPRIDNERDRHKDSTYYRQQSIVKKVLEAKNPFKKSAWEKMLDKNPAHVESEKRAQEAKAGLQKANDDYQAILDKEAKKKTNEAFIAEIGDTPKGQDRLDRTKLRATSRAGAAAGEGVVGHLGYSPKDVKKNNKVVAQASKRITPLSMSPSSNPELEMEDTAPWDKKNPKKTHSHLTPAQKAEAKARAKAAGRPYPNWVDNVDVAKEETKYPMSRNSEDAHFARQSKPMQDAINLHLRKGKSYPEAVKAAKVHVKESVNLAQQAAIAIAVKKKKEKMKEETLHEGVAYHLDNSLPLSESIYRYGSEMFFETIEEARRLFNEGLIDLTYNDIELIRSDIGSFGIFEGNEVPLDLPLTEEEDKDHPALGKPHKGGPKKYYVYVKKPDGGIKKVTFGDSHGAADGSTLPSRINDPVARKSFAARHKCHLQTDRTSAAYWSCNLPRYAKALGLSGGGNFYW